MKALTIDKLRYLQLTTLKHTFRLINKFIFVLLFYRTPQQENEENVVAFALGFEIEEGSHR